jgi:hypothetical protein
MPEEKGGGPAVVDGGGDGGARAGVKNEVGGNLDLCIASAWHGLV